MPAVTKSKPIDLEPTQAQAANVSAPSMVASASSQAVTTAPTSTVAACSAVASMWAGLSATVVEEETTRQGLIAIGQRRLLGTYQRQTEAVTTLVTINDDNRQALTLLPGTGTVAV